MLKFTASIALDAAAEDGTPKRTITGVAVPYGQAATVSDGTQVRFEAGALPVDGKAPKLFLYHDATQPVGVVTERVDTPEGMMFAAKIAKTVAGDEALQLAQEGVLDSVSVGVNPTKFRYDKDGVMVVTAADWLELSMVPVPAFAGAIITDVAASAETIPTIEEPVAIVAAEETTKENPVSESPAVIEASTVAPVVFAQPKAFKMPSAAEYISKVLAGGAESQQFFANLRAAAPDVITTDTPGILPEPIVGAVYDNFRGLRPVVDACGVKAMPGGGKIFRRPEVTTHTTIGASNGENAALDSGTFVVSNNNVTKGVYGGYVKLSEEDMDWTEPAVLGLLINDMAKIYANETDNVAADALVTGASVTTAFPSPMTDPSNWADWMYTAAAAILSGSNGNLPTHLFLSPDQWAAIGKLSDDQNRPLFPQVGPMNAFGTMTPGSSSATAFGLTVVVDRNFAAGTIIIGDPSGFEIFETPKGAVQVEATDGSLSKIIKFRGYFATLMIDNQKFRKAV
jgi:HK97 family phage prohead protease/HK97 family phage major capsid protein